jgi:hypothetical protein
MDAKATVSVLFPKSSAVPYHEVTVLEVAKTIIDMKLTPKTEPLLLTVQGQKEQLYYNRYMFWLYAKGKISYADLLASCWCHGLYRNNAELVGPAAETVDAHSLWMLRHNTLLLVDDNRHVTQSSATIDALFYNVEKVP